MPFTDHKKQSRNNRKRNLEFIRAVKAGKKIIKPWEGKTIVWIEDKDGKLSWRDFKGGKYIIERSEFDEYCEVMGGDHLVFEMARDCMPIGTVPEVKEEPNLIQRAIHAVEDFFHIEQKPEAELTDEEKKERWWKRYGKKHADKEPAKVVKMDPEPVRGLDFITAGFKPSDELVEQRELVEEMNFSTRNYSYGI